MFDSIRNVFQRKNFEREEMEKGFRQGFYDLPDTHERATMTAEDLAILLAGLEAGKPAHILVEHELNLRIAHVQAKAAARASYVGIVGVVVGVILTAIFAVLLLKYPPNEPPKAVQPASERNSDSAAKVRVNDNIPTGNPSVVISIQTDHQAAEKQKPGTKK